MGRIPTKERIMDAALTLFAQKGYDGTSVDEIAEAIGIKGPSLYKHFKGKEDLLNALIAQMDALYESKPGKGINPGPLPANGEELVQFTLQRVAFTMHHNRIQKARRILNMEQYRNPKLAKLASLHFIDAMEGMFRGIFAGMMAAGTLRKDDPAMLATQYVAPVTQLIHMYDRQPEREAEIMERIEKHLRHFVSVYCEKK